MLEDSVAKVRELPEAEQDMAAAELMRFLASTRDPQLSDELLAGLDRRLADPDPKTLTLDELDARWRRLGV